MADDLTSKIHAWLDKHGYPLEMRVARAFRDAGFEVSSSEYYIDRDEQKPREIDVLASLSTTMQGLQFQITYVVECKSPKDSPWVCFRSNDRARESSVGFLSRLATREARRALIELSVRPDVTTTQLLGLPDQHAYGVTNALKENNKDIPYGAIRAARGAAEALVAYIDRMQAPPEPISYASIVFPLLVTSAPLFTASLAPSGDVEVREAEHETILRVGFDTPYAIVEVVTSSALPKFIAAQRELIARFLKRLPHRIPNTLQELGYANLAAEKDE